MRLVAVIPMRHDSQRVPGKNYRHLGKVPLYHHIARTLLTVPDIDEVIIDTDSPIIIDDAARAFPEIRVIERPEHLRDGKIPMNDVLLNTVSQLEANVVLQTHSTNPFLSAAVLAEAITRFTAGENDCDSAFGVTRFQARLWTSDAKPINHDPSVLQRTQDLEPVFLENSCFYIFTPEILQSLGNRIGERPLMIEVPSEQAIDIDEESDFRLAQAIASIAPAGGR